MVVNQIVHMSSYTADDTPPTPLHHILPLSFTAQSYITSILQYLPLIELIKLCEHVLLLNRHTSQGAAQRLSEWRFTTREAPPPAFRPPDWCLLSPLSNSFNVLPAFSGVLLAMSGSAAASLSPHLPTALLAHFRLRLSPAPASDPPSPPEPPVPPDPPDPPLEQIRVTPFHGSLSKSGQSSLQPCTVLLPLLTTRPVPVLLLHVSFVGPGLESTIFSPISPSLHFSQILDLSAYSHVASSGLLATPFVPFGGTHFAFRRSFTAVCRFCSGLDPVSFSTRFVSGLLILTVYLSFNKALMVHLPWMRSHDYSFMEFYFLPLIEAPSLSLPLIEAPLHRIPRNEAFSCYTDAAWIASSGSCGMGWIFKTQDHRVIHRGSATRLHTPTALAAKALALRSALIAASRMEFTSIKVFSDSQVLISLLITETTTNELQGILHDIAFFSRSLLSIKFLFVPRKSNMLVDALAMSALSSLTVLATPALILLSYPIATSTDAIPINSDTSFNMYVITSIASITD
ncbi:Ribonuclease H domain [Arabidopsis suecica]|uniref:Ribonuclease H domain n=1 Tax=Arabidopsis suecica TaxID=45249 RepID=A0A8T1YET0_ARASU|nr:Ribonuclease H domain [Arabidopsis suecica]